MAKDRFVKIYNQGTLNITEIWVDRETGVNYVFHASGYAGGLTPLLDRQGNPVVVAAPFWDLSFPAALRTYIEYISANGLTYHYEADGCHGDCRAQRLVYLTSGGDVEREDSLGVLYWRQLTAMFGIPQFDYVFAGGVDLDPAKAPELVAAAAETARRLAEEV